VSEFEDSFIGFLQTHEIQHQKEFHPIFQRQVITAAQNVSFKLNKIGANSGLENKALWDLAKENQIKLIQIWEDLWLTKREISQSRVLAALGKIKKIHGRETSVVKINNNQLIDFLEKNHLAIPLKGKHKFGLLYRDQLVTVISFSYPRNFGSGDQKIKSYEILRFCHVNGHSVVGGLSKLLKHFIENYKADHLMTYIDKDWGDGEGFETIGFTKSNELAPGKFYIHPETKMRIQNISYHQTENKLDSTEKYILAYNSGSLKYTKLTKAGESI